MTGGPWRQHIHSWASLSGSFLLCRSAAPTQMPPASPLQSYLACEMTCAGVATHLFLMRVAFRRLAAKAKLCSFSSRETVSPSMFKSLNLVKLDLTQLRLSWMTMSLTLLSPTFSMNPFSLMWFIRSMLPQICMNPAFVRPYPQSPKEGSRELLSMPSHFRLSPYLPTQATTFLKLRSGCLQSQAKYLPFSEPNPLELLSSAWKPISWSFLVNQQKLWSLETVEMRSEGRSSSNGRLQKNLSSKKVTLSMPEGEAGTGDQYPTTSSFPPFFFCYFAPFLVLSTTTLGLALGVLKIQSSYLSHQPLNPSRLDLMSLSLGWNCQLRRASFCWSSQGVLVTTFLQLNSSSSSFQYVLSQFRPMSLDLSTTRLCARSPSVISIPQQILVRDLFSWKTTTIEFLGTSFKLSSKVLKVVRLVSSFYLEQRVSFRLQQVACSSSLRAAKQGWVGLSLFFKNLADCSTEHTCWNLDKYQNDCRFCNYVSCSTLASNALAWQIDPLSTSKLMPQSFCSWVALKLAASQMASSDRRFSRVVTNSCRLSSLGKRVDLLSRWAQMSFRMVRDSSRLLSWAAKGALFLAMSLLSSFKQSMILTLL